jgi:hypothetical protein
MHNTEYDLSIGPFVVVPRAMFSSTLPSKGLEMGFLSSRSHSEGSVNVRFGSISLSLAKLTLGQVARWFAENRNIWMGSGGFAGSAALLKVAYQTPRIAPIAAMIVHVADVSRGGRMLVRLHPVCQARTAELDT